MPSMIEQDPDVCMHDSFKGLSTKKITRRERLRMRALIGGVSVKTLATLTPAQLVDVLNDAQRNPGAYAGGPDVRRELTEELALHRIPDVARHYLHHLNCEVPPEAKDASVNETDTLTPAMPPRGRPRLLSMHQISDALGETPYGPPPKRRWKPKSRSHRGSAGAE